MAGKNNTAAPAANEEKVLSFEELAAQAREQFGELSAEDRLSGESSLFPIFQVVGATAGDASYYDEERDENISRAGQFRLLKGSEIVSYVKSLAGFVVLDNRIAQTAYVDSKPVCHGLTQDGLFDPVCVSRSSEMNVLGGSCQRCALWRWNKAEIHPLTGKPMTDKDFCKGGLELYVWFPEGGPEGVEFARVRFTSMAIKAWKSTIAPIEDKGAKLWAFLCALRAKRVQSEQADQSDHYEPILTPSRILDGETFAKAEKAREELKEILRAKAAQKAAALPEGEKPKALSGGVEPDPFDKQ